jgi:hypothetical protein
MLSDDRPDSIPVVVASGRGASRTTETRDITLEWNPDGSATARASRADMSLTRFNLALAVKFGARAKIGKLKLQDAEYTVEIAAPFAKAPQCEGWVPRFGQPSVRCTNDATRRITIELDDSIPSVLEPENTIELCDTCAGRYQENSGQRIVSNEPIAPQAEVQGVPA